MRNTIVALFFLIAATACGSNARYFESLRVYRSPAPADCAAIACGSSAYFCPSGHAQLAITDYLIEARYRIDGRAIEVTSQGQATPESYRFVMSEDESTLDELGSDRAWQRDLTAEGMAGSYTCSTR